MADTFKLPASSMEEFLKIIQAYGSEKEGAILSLDDISHSTGVPRTVVSANNGFLVQVGLITEGSKKSATEIGRLLGRAYISKINDEIERIWKEIVAENDFLGRMISAVRIRNGMDRTSFLNHIIYSSGQKENKQNRAGANCIIDILKAVNILNETDGKLTVVEASSSEIVDKKSSMMQTNTIQPSSLNRVPVTTVKTDNMISININIDCSVSEIDILVEKIQKLIKGLSE